MKTLTSFLLTLIVVSQATAQIEVDIPVATDTIALARSSAYQKDFVKADQLLTRYTADHQDFYALGLHAQVLYWMKAFDRSTEVYEKAIGLFPAPSSLHLDYARVLYNSGKLAKSRRLLKVYRHFDSTNAEAEIMTAYLDLWNGKTGIARKKAGVLLQKYPGNAEAQNILATIKNYTIPYIKTGTEFIADDQPLKGYTFYAEGGAYRSWLFAPAARAAYYQYQAEDSSFHALWLQLSNSFQLGTKNKIKLKGGVFQQNGDAKDFTAGAEISQQVARYFLLQAAVERRPYQYAISSVKNIVMEDVSGISLSYNRKNKWLGKAGYELFGYQDHNNIHTAYVWLLAPVISRPRFALSGGYAFRYADATDNRFVSKKTIPQLISTYSYDAISGTYSPYFTPENQRIHSALASVKLVPVKKLEFTSRINIGFFAEADNPYLWLGKQGSDLVIEKGFMKVEFMPATWVNELRVAVSGKLSIAANYSYDQLLYYKSHKGSLELKYLFSK